MDQYFKKVTDTDADKAIAERLKMKREFVTLKNKNLNPYDYDAQATHHLMDVGENYYDKVGSRSGVVSWGFDHDRHRWWIKRKVGVVEWYKKPCPVSNIHEGGLNYSIKREVAHGFPSMHTAESIVTPAAKGVRDPRTNKRMKIVSWPPTDKEKTIPLVKKNPKGALKTMHFWAYDEWLGSCMRN
ncbi:hypothetical protein Hanom_Chr13g01201581 [Helianthus anomalus]